MRLFSSSESIEHRIALSSPQPGSSQGFSCSPSSSLQGLRLASFRASRNGGLDIHHRHIARIRVGWQIDHRDLVEFAGFRNVIDHLPSCIIDLLDVFATFLFATSDGVKTAEYKLAPDLIGLLVCAGRLKVISFHKCGFCQIRAALPNDVIGSDDQLNVVLIADNAIFIKTFQAIRPSGERNCPTIRSRVRRACHKGRFASFFVNTFSIDKCDFNIILFSIVLFVICL